MFAVVAAFMERTTFPLAALATVTVRLAVTLDE
jgi:hypothetical protein